MKALVFDNYKSMFNSINKYLGIASINYQIIKFNNGEGKVLIKDNVKGEDVVIFSDFSNAGEYTYLNKKRAYSKDEYYVELKRVISALDLAKSISVFLPLIYQSRQNSNNCNESKDYLMFVEDLKRMGVKNIITFEVHGEEKKVSSYSLSNLFKNKDYDVVVSPDEGGVKRSLEYSKILKCDNYHFTKSRDLTTLIEGSNPIKDYHGDNYSFKDKRVLIVDDILDSGNTLINSINLIKDSKSVDVFVAYPLFSKGVKEFKRLVKENKLNKIYLSNLININKEILKQDFIEIIDVSKLVSDLLKEVI